MGRYGTEHKEATRRRIVEVAGRRLKRDGIDGSGIATLMSDAGLTNGAFYAPVGARYAPFLPEAVCVGTERALGRRLYVDRHTMVRGRRWDCR